MGKKQHVNLGKSLINKNKIEWSRKSNAERHTVEDPTTALKSVTEESSYDEFMATAAIAQKDFTAQKLNIKFVTLDIGNSDLNATDVTEEEKKLVVVPRRPKWTKEMTGEELDEAEKDAFLKWRRSMAGLQEKEGITPFERNIEVWRQLWRVIEKSDIVVQIVDARNPLLYRCDDLETYVKEMGKRPVLLVNKADYLTDKQREWWSRYFSNIKLPHAFYSAVAATEALKETIEEDEEAQIDDEDDADEVTGDEEEGEKQQEELPDEYTEGKESQIESATVEPAFKSEFSPFGTTVLGREGLVEFLRSFNTDSAELFNVGLVGYPNVGKSSTINSLVASKKTSVSSTPGKTKHFQTLFLEEDILLCDCPGLVMPAFGGSKGAMVLGGILPIDQLRDYAPAMALVREQIPKAVIEQKYGVTLPEEYNHDDILSAYAHMRGFMTARGLPDNSRASRLVLKDYVEGRINYCHAPPTVEQNEFHPDVNYPDFLKSCAKASAASAKEESGIVAPKKCTLRKPNAEKSLDTQFFTPVENAAHIKGKVYIPSGLSSVSSSTTGLNDKPWKKHNNKHKKEKLRRLYRHLDVE